VRAIRPEDKAMLREGEQSVGEVIEGDGDRVAGLELHEHRVEDGDDLSLVVAVETDQRPLDGGDHAEGLDVPPRRGVGEGGRVGAHGWDGVCRRGRLRARRGGQAGGRGAARARAAGRR